MVRNCYDICKDVLGKHYDFDGGGGGPGGLYQCLTSDHYVRLYDGSYTSVKNLQKGDRLSTGNTVLSNKPERKKVFTMNTTQGKFTVTEDHKVFLLSGGFKEASKLVFGEKLVTDLTGEPDKDKLDALKNHIYNEDKIALLNLQRMCHITGWYTYLTRKGTGWLLVIDKTKSPCVRFISLEDTYSEDTVYVLEVSGDRSYFADNLLHHNCYDLANYVASFFGTRLVGPVAATIVYDNPQLYRLALVKTYDGQLETGDMIIFGPVAYNPAGHVAFYGHGDQTSATCIDQNHPASSGVTEHTFNLLPLNPTHIVRFYNQEGYSAGGQSSNNQPGTISGNDTTKTKSRTYQFWEVTCDETEVLKEKDGEFIEKTFQCSKYTGLEDGDWIKIDRWDGSAGYVRKSCAKRREDLDVVVTTKKDASVTNDLPSGTANYDGGDISYGGYVLAKDKISAMASACAKYGIWLPGFICQTYLETNWGQSPGASYAGPENNWGGLTWTGNPQRESGVVVSQGAPRAEGGYYMKFASLKDYFEDHCNLISDRIGGADALYHANNKYDIESFTRGLFRPVAKYDYAAVGLGAYIAQMSSIYNGMKPQLDEVMGHIKEGEPLPTAPAVTNPTFPKIEVPKPKLPPLKTGNKATDRRSRWI
jgi:phage protein